MNKYDVNFAAYIDGVQLTASAADVAADTEHEAITKALPIVKTATNIDGWVPTSVWCQDK